MLKILGLREEGSIKGHAGNEPQMSVEVDVRSDVGGGASNGEASSPSTGKADIVDDEKSAEA
jgi:hypothetical protein